MAYTGNAYEKTHITGQVTTLIASGKGVLHCVTVNKPTATGTIELDDAVTNTNPFGIITTGTGVVTPYSLPYDVIFQNGLSITTSVADQDITVSWNYL